MATMTTMTTQQPPNEQEPIPSPSHLDGIAYLYGHPLVNSLSPPLHQIVYNSLGLNWSQIPLSSVVSGVTTTTYTYTHSPPIPNFLATVKANPKFVGASVTMPWKVSIMPHLDELTDDARQAGACNTIFVRHAQNGLPRVLVGTNTDCIGIREALRRNQLVAEEETNQNQYQNQIHDPFRNKPALVIGGGGTARTAMYVLRRWLGVSTIYIVNRDRAEVEAILAEDRCRRKDAIAAGMGGAEIVHVTDPEEAARLEPPAVIVSGIPNYAPKTVEECTARKIIQAFLRSPPSSSSTGGYKGVILEMCYHPVPWTEIAQLASSAGWKVILGSEALIWQGLEQARLWTGKDVVAVPGLVDQVKDYVAKAVAERAAAVKPNL